MAKHGFSRARIDGEVRELTDEIRLDRYYQHTIEVIVDRLVRKEGMEQRLTQSLETALSLAEGVADDRSFLICRKRRIFRSLRATF